MVIFGANEQAKNMAREVSRQEVAFILSLHLLGDQVLFWRLSTCHVVCLLIDYQPSISSATSSTLLHPECPCTVSSWRIETNINKCRDGHFHPIHSHSPRWGGGSQFDPCFANVRNTIPGSFSHYILTSECPLLIRDVGPFCCVLKMRTCLSLFWWRRGSIYFYWVKFFLANYGHLSSSANQ